MSTAYRHIKIPATGEKISIRNGKLHVPDQPIVGYVEGDGIGPDITKACLRIWDAAIDKAYGGKRKIHWCETYLGEKGADALNRHAPLIEMLQQQNDLKHWLGAICAAPALTLAPHHLLDGRQATCYPAFKARLPRYVDKPVVVDGHIITSQGPATAMAFALILAEILAGPVKSKEVAAALLA